jgi:hypothetical protein
MRSFTSLPGSIGAVAALLVLAACGRDELPPRSTLELMDDPVVLQAVLNRCNELGLIHDQECRNAREAIARLEAQQAPEVVKEKQAQVESEFERAREKRRQREELERRRQEAQQQRQADPYTLPLVDPTQGAQVEEETPPSS